MRTMRPGILALGTVALGTLVPKTLKADPATPESSTTCYASQYRALMPGIEKSSLVQLYQAVYLMKVDPETEPTKIDPRENFTGSGLPVDSLSDGAHACYAELVKGNAGLLSKGEEARAAIKALNTDDDQNNLKLKEEVEAGLKSQGKGESDITRISMEISSYGVVTAIITAEPPSKDQKPISVDNIPLPTNLPADPTALEKPADHISLEGLEELVNKLRWEIGLLSQRALPIVGFLALFLGAVVLLGRTDFMRRLIRVPRQMSLLVRTMLLVIPGRNRFQDWVIKHGIKVETDRMERLKANLLQAKERKEQFEDYLRGEAKKPSLPKTKGDIARDVVKVTAIAGLGFAAYEWQEVAKAIVWLLGKTL